MSRLYSSRGTSCPCGALSLSARSSDSPELLREILPANDINRLAAMREEWAAGSESTSETAPSLELMLRSKPRSAEHDTGRTQMTATSPMKWSEESEKELEGLGYDLAEVTHMPIETRPPLSELDECSWAERGVSVLSPISSQVACESGREVVEEMERHDCGDEVREDGIVRGLDKEQLELLGRVRELAGALHRRQLGLELQAGDEDVLEWGKGISVCLEMV